MGELVGTEKAICAVVLAGGQATRMGGVDKGLQLFKGQPLALYAVQRLQAQTLGAPGCIAINANRNLADYAAWGLPVWPDAQAEFAGPLAGFLAALERCTNPEHPEKKYPYLMTVPCDSPLFPLDLAQRLAHALDASSADIAVACTQGRAQPVFSLMRTTVCDDLRAYMAQGGRKIATWMAQQRTVEVPFDTPSDDPQAFFNTNTPEQLSQLEQS